MKHAEGVDPDEFSSDDSDDSLLLEEDMIRMLTHLLVVMPSFTRNVHTFGESIACGSSDGDENFWRDMLLMEINFYFLTHEFYFLTQGSS